MPANDIDEGELQLELQLRVIHYVPTGCPTPLVDSEEGAGMSIRAIQASGS